jgi:hypothetical protein
MKKSTSDQSNQQNSDQNKPQRKLRKTFSLFTDIIEAEAKSKNITVEEVMENMRRQCVITLIPHEEVMRELIGPDGDKEADEVTDISSAEKSESEDEQGKI